MGYLMPKPSLLKNTSDNIHSWGDKGFHAFRKGISLKVNIIARLVIELYY